MHNIAAFTLMFMSCIHLCEYEKSLNFLLHARMFRLFVILFAAFFSIADYFMRFVCVISVFVRSEVTPCVFPYRIFKVLILQTDFLCHGLGRQQFVVRQ